MEMNTEPQPNTNSVLNWKEKFAFFCVNLGNIPIMTLLGMYLLMFYTDVVGLDPIAIGTLFLIARVLDGFNDPLMGYVVDHLPRTKMGRFRPYLLIGVIVCSINYLILWLGTSIAPTGKLIIAYISYILLGFTFDLMDIPLNSMIPVMSDRNKDRNLLSIIKGLGYMIGAGVVIIPGMLFITNFPTKREGFYMLIIFATAIVLLFSIFGTLGIKERVFPMKKEKYKLRDVKDILLSKPVFILFLQTLLTQIGSGISSGAGAYFFLYVLNRPDLFPLMGISAIIGFALGAPLTPLLVKKFDKKNTITITGVVGLLCTVILFFTPRNMPYIFIIMVGISAPAGTISMLLSYGIQADNMDYVEWKLGYRAEGAVASMNSFIIKAAGGIGSAVGAYLLIFIHYVPNAEVQRAETITGFYYMNYLIPALFSLIALLIWVFGYPLTLSVRNRMMDELRKRRTSEAIDISKMEIPHNLKL